MRSKSHLLTVIEEAATQLVEDEIMDLLWDRVDAGKMTSEEADWVADNVRYSVVARAKERTHEEADDN